LVAGRNSVKSVSGIALIVFSNDSLKKENGKYSIEI
jgi:hypothetical protein